MLTRFKQTERLGPRVPEYSPPYVDRVGYSVYGDFMMVLGASIVYLLQGGLTLPTLLQDCPCQTSEMEQPKPLSLGVTSR